MSPPTSTPRGVFAAALFLACTKTNANANGEALGAAGTDPVNVETLRETQLYLSGRPLSFEAKLRFAVNGTSSTRGEDGGIVKAGKKGSAFALFRTFPGAFYADLAKTPALTAGAPPSEGTCLGDAHPDNFGWLWFRSGGKDTYVFGYNDLDDAGAPCVLAIDALRFFVGAYLKGVEKENDLKSLRDAYVRGLAGSRPTQPASPPTGIEWGDPIDLASCADDSSRPGNGATDGPGGGALKPCIKTAGGSAGQYRMAYDRTADDGGVEPWELKELVKPAQLFAKADSNVPEPDERIAWVRNTLWGAGEDDHFSQVRYAELPYLIRSRIRIADERAADFPSAAGADAGSDKAASMQWKAQWIGWVHSKSEPANPDSFATFLSATTAPVAGRWQALYKHLKALDGGVPNPSPQ